MIIRWFIRCCILRYSQTKLESATALVPSRLHGCFVQVSFHFVRWETLFSFQPFLLFQLISLCLYSSSSLLLLLLSYSRSRQLYANDLFYSCCLKVLVCVNGLHHCGPMVSINGVPVEPTERFCRYKNCWVGEKECEEDILEGSGG